LKTANKFKLLSCCLLVLLLFACASNKDLILIRQDIASLKSDFSYLQAEKEEIIKKLTILEKRLEGDLTQFQRTQADMGLKIEEVTTEIQILNEKLDDTNFRISSLSQQLAGLRLMERQSPYDRQQPERQPEVEADTEEGAYTVLRPATPEELYNTARADFLKGNYELAIEGFKQYIQVYPDSELADNTQYWIGECYYSQQKFSQAVQEFDKVINKYPTGDKVVSAHLKKAFAYFELNQIARGVIQLQQLIQEFPNSNEARIARERLESLGLEP